eukprot:scaffold84427_cov48-Phaeocystis_antarctica.AAC.1
MDSELQQRLARQKQAQAAETAKALPAVFQVASQRSVFLTLKPYRAALYALVTLTGRIMRTSVLAPALGGGALLK